MALASTSFSSASMVAKVKAAMRAAAKSQSLPVSCVRNRHGHVTMLVGYYRGQGFGFWFDGRDITNLVMQGARIYHAAQQEQQQ